MIRAGPVGRISSGRNGDQVTWDERGRTMISHIYVSFNSNNLITSIQFGYLENGALVLSKRFGHSEGHNFRAVILKPGEFVTGLSGVVIPSGGIHNLTFHTNCGNHAPMGNLDDYHPIGNLDGNHSYDQIEIHPGIRVRREFGGFFGSYNGSNLSTIGIYATPIVMFDKP